MQDSERDRLTVEVCEAVSAISPAGSHLATTAARLREMVGKEAPASDYMKEAERLLDDVVRAATMWDGHGVQADVAYRESRAALLAHIQRGAVPEALDPEFLIGYLEEREDWRGREVLIERIRQAAAPAPDQFRDAAKMMAEPAEVPMPEPDVVGYVERWGGACRDCADESGVCPSTGMPCGGARKAIEYVIRALQYGVTHGYISNPISGDAREAAGYARGLAEALRAASGVGKFVGAGDGETRVVGSSAEAVQAIKQLQRAALRGEVK